MGAERRLSADHHFGACEPDARLDALADRCIEAKKLADEVGTASMRRLAELLLFEVGRALAEHERSEERLSADDPV